MHSIKHTSSSYESPRKSPEIKQDDQDCSSRLLSSKEHNDKKQKCKNSSPTTTTITTGSKPSSPSPDAEASFRVYYGATGNVPFLWESAPGTPKHKSNDSSVPPLTPPPSYSYNDSKSKAQNSRAHKSGRYKLSSSPKIFSIINLPKLHRRRRSNSSSSYVTPTSTSTPTYSPTSLDSIFSSSSSSSFSPETLTPIRQPRRRSFVFSRRRPQLFAAHHDDMDEVDDDQEGRRHGVAGAPKSWLMCFRSAGCFGGGASSFSSSSSSGWNGCYTVKKALSSSVVGRRTVTYMA